MALALTPSSSTYADGATVNVHWETAGSEGEEVAYGVSPSSVALDASQDAYFIASVNVDANGDADVVGLELYGIVDPVVAATEYRVVMRNETSGLYEASASFTLPESTGGQPAKLGLSLGLGL